MCTSGCQGAGGAAAWPGFASCDLPPAGRTVQWFVGGTLGASVRGSSAGRVIQPFPIQHTPIKLPSTTKAKYATNIVSQILINRDLMCQKRQTLVFKTPPLYCAVSHQEVA